MKVWTGSGQAQGGGGIKAKEGKHGLGSEVHGKNAMRVPCRIHTSLQVAHFPCRVHTPQPGHDMQWGQMSEQACDWDQYTRVREVKPCGGSGLGDGSGLTDKENTLGTEDERIRL